MADNPARRVRTRTRPRVEETEPNDKKVKRSAKHRGSTAGAEGNDAIKKLYRTNTEAGYEITAQASELAPVAQYASVTIGPVAIKRTVIVDASTDDDSDLLGKVLEAALEEVQNVVEDVVSKDRNLVLESVAEHNRREREMAEEESKAKAAKARKPAARSRSRSR